MVGDVAVWEVMLSNQKIEQRQLSIIDAEYIEAAVTNLCAVEDLKIAGYAWDEHTECQVLRNTIKQS